MVWQDFVAATCTLLFTYALIPQVIKGFRQKRGVIEFQTGAITFICLYILAGTMLTLELYYTSAMNFLAGTLWLLLFLQKVIYK